MSEIGIPSGSIKVEKRSEYIKVKGESHSTENPKDISLYIEDPLFDGTAEEESERRLRPRRIPLNLYESSSEDELIHNGRNKKKVAPPAKAKKRSKNENVLQVEQACISPQPAQNCPPKKRILAAIRLDLQEQRSDTVVKVEEFDLVSLAIKTEIVTEDKFVQRNPLNTAQCVNAEAAIKEEPCYLGNMAAPIATSDPLNSPIIDATKFEGRSELTKNVRNLREASNEAELRAERKRKAFASLRNRWTDMARLRGKAIASIVPDDEDEDCSTSLAEIKRMLGGTSDAEGNDESSSSERECLTLTQQRQRRVHKNQAEAQERALRQRIRNMKQRLHAQLMSTEEEWKAEKARKVAEARTKRKRRYEKETPEQKAARKKRENFLHNEGRKRTKTLETVEERAARTARERERLKERMAKESPEKRAARKERERLNRANQKRRRLEKSQTEKIVNVSPNTGSNK